GHAVNARRLDLGMSARRGRHLSMAFVGQSQLRITKQAAFGFIRLATRRQVTLERLVQRGSGALVHPGKVIDGFFCRGNGDEGGGGSIHENVLNRELQAILPRFDGEGMSSMWNPATHIYQARRSMQRRPSCSRRPDCQPLIPSAGYATGTTAPWPVPARPWGRGQWSARCR